MAVPSCSLRDMPCMHPMSNRYTQHLVLEEACIQLTQRTRDARAWKTLRRRLFPPSGGKKHDTQVHASATVLRAGRMDKRAWWQLKLRKEQTNTILRFLLPPSRRRHDKTRQDNHQRSYKQPSALRRRGVAELFGASPAATHMKLTRHAPRMDRPAALS